MIRTICRGAGALFLAVAVTAALAQHKHKHHGHDHGGQPPLPKQAVAVMAPTQGNSGVGGTIRLSQEKGYVRVKGTISGLTPGLHGFHIHQFGDLTAPDGTSAGSHFDPDGHKHGGLDSHERHAGDLGNVEAGEDGTAHVNIKAPGLKLHFVIGRSLVVHAKQDDLKSQPAGDSGPRVGVGVIGIAQTTPPPTKPPATR